MEGLAEIEDLKVRRWYGFLKDTVVTLHLLSNLSDIGYGTVAYFQALGFKCALFAAKGKGHQPKETSINSKKRGARPGSWCLPCCEPLALKTHLAARGR